ncbi:hypothetical protein KIN20_009633 [Parelaphostrongylus tenuis]|uniref:Uncharacterized protein n=1 Tax=Parelaphostrongylus tenuis TaxID=148309 RepID=A0AAD5QLE4_PARTN|nr:hypothetical protein KIN20_009633 [Parelaphostrongylus tenuis]
MEKKNQPGGAGITYDGANRERCHADRLDAITFVSTERVGHSADGEFPAEDDVSLA